jgi:hypothetical protein
MPNRGTTKTYQALHLDKSIPRDRVRSCQEVCKRDQAAALALPRFSPTPSRYTTPSATSHAQLLGQPAGKCRVGGGGGLGRRVTTGQATVRAGVREPSETGPGRRPCPTKPLTVCAARALGDDLSSTGQSWCSAPLCYTAGVKNKSARARSASPIRMSIPSCLSRWPHSHRKQTAKKLVAYAGLAPKCAGQRGTGGVRPDHATAGE